MPKYSYKLKKRRIRYTKPYTCDKPNFVTNWPGVLLDKEARQKVKIGDRVRIQSRESGTCYVEIRRAYRDRLIGILNDPYYFNDAFCNICDNILNYKKKNYTKKSDDFFHVCHKCYPSYENKEKLIIYNHPRFRQGSVMRFKRNDISEIPDWTKNTEKIGNLYKNKNNLGILMTGSF